MIDNPYIIKHEPSGDEAEAETLAAAKTAARQLIADNDNEGRCTVVFNGQIVGWWSSSARGVLFVDFHQ